MNKYINGGIMKEITIFVKSKEDEVELFSHLADFIDLDLYDLTTYDDNSYYLELKEDILRKNILDFLRELNETGIYDDMEISDMITSVKEKLKDNTGCVLENCDDIFKDRYRMEDYFSIYDSRFSMDILYYAFYFDGPFMEGDYNLLLKYVHLLNRKALKNTLKGSLCFGYN